MEEGRKKNKKQEEKALHPVLHLFIHSLIFINLTLWWEHRASKYTFNKFLFAQVIKNWYLLLTTRAAWLMQLWNPRVWEPLLGVALTPALREHTACRPPLPPTPTPKPSSPHNPVPSAHRTSCTGLWVWLHTTLQKSLDTSVPSLHCRQPEYTNQCLVHPCISRAW